MTGARDVGARSSGRAVAIVCRTERVLQSDLPSRVRLSPHEVARQRRVPSAAGLDYLAAHVLARLVVAAASSQRLAEVELAQRCSSCDARDHGAPSVTSRPSWHVSWSHADGVVAAAAGPGPVGIDIERRSTFRDSPRLVARVLGPEGARATRSAADPGRAFLERWTTRECLVKVGSAQLIGSFDEFAVVRRLRLSRQVFACETTDVVGSCVSSAPVRFERLDSVVAAHGAVR